MTISAFFFFQFIHIGQPSTRLHPLEKMVDKDDAFRIFHSSWGRMIFRLGCPGGVMVKAMDCSIVVCEFVLQSRYYVHFRENTLGKGMIPLILPAMG